MLPRAIHWVRWAWAVAASVPFFLTAVRYRAGWRGGPGRGESPRRLRVLFLHRDLPFHGGVPRCILYMARACDRERIDVRVASFREGSPQMAAAFAELGITPVSLGDGGYLGPARRLRKILKAERIDVVVGTSFKAYLVGKAASAGLAARPMFWVHAVHGAVNGRFRRAVLGQLARRDPMLFVSEAVRKARPAARPRRPVRGHLQRRRGRRRPPRLRPLPAVAPAGVRR